MYNTNDWFYFTGALDKNTCNKIRNSAKNKWKRAIVHVNENITEEELKNITVRMGFVNVIDAFHVVAREETTRFFTDNRSNNKSIILTDNF